MIRNFLNKMRRPEQPIDPRARLAALVEVRHDAFLSAETKYTAGIVDAATFERAKADVDDAQSALAAYDAEREQAAATAERRAERGTSLKHEALALDAEIEATVATLEQLLAKAQPIVDEIRRDFGVVGGLADPFKGSAITDRLTFWSRGVSAFNGSHVWCELGRFTDRVREYRRLMAPPAPEPTVYRPTPETTAQKAARKRQATENSRLRMKRPVDGRGIVVEASVEAA